MEEHLASCHATTVPRAGCRLVNAECPWTPRAVSGGRGHPVDHRLEGPPVGADPVDQLGRVDHRLEAVELPGEQLLVAEQLDPRVFGVVPARSRRGRRPAVPRTPRRSHRRRGPRGRRSRGTSRWPARPRRTHPGWSCTASCPSRTARPGRGGTPWRCRTPAPALRPGRASDPSRRRRRPPCGPPRRTWCCPSRGRRRSRARPWGSPGSRSRGNASAGADDETRTRDIDLGKVALYQLSYIRSDPVGSPSC